MILILYHSNTKKCFKCGIEKKLFEFYKHKEMKDGYLNKCKSCTKKDTKNNYNKNIINYKLYEWKRSDYEHRKLLRKNYYNKNKKRHRKKQTALNANISLSNAIRDKKIIKGKCLICNTDKNIQGHHFDYSKPLEVWWLCIKHHNRIHKILNLIKLLR